ncbi:MAG: DoxX family protein [Bacteroidales bacterium]|nr:DoxX family protein [Bacteroidales bacterium]
MGRLQRLCAVIVGSVFFIAGTFKLIDPVGASLVVSEYFKFFHVAFLKVIAEPVAIFMALAECVTGAALISGVYKKLAWLVAVALTGFFTVLTAIFAIVNPHFDCGCFGEAIHLTHIQTFLKNVVLLALLAMMFRPKDNETTAKQRVPWLIVCLSVVFLTLYSLISIPFIDFTPFEPGATVKAALPEDALPTEEYMATFIYEKDGQEGSFTLDRLPDSTWTFVRTETYLANGPASSESIADFAITDAEGHYRDDDIIEGNVIVVSSYNPNGLSSSSYARVASFIERATAVGFKTLFVVASDPLSYESLLSEKSLDAQSKMTLLTSTYFGDYKTLITVNRSNGGATWFNDGEVLTKFATFNLPNKDKLKEMSEANPLETVLSTDSRGRLWLQGYFLYTFAVMLLL